MAVSGGRVRDVPAVLLTAGRLILRHWPALLALAFLGAGVRAGALWLAVLVSDTNAFLGQLILVIAPLGYLLPVIAMLHLCRGSLPRLSALGQEAGPEAPTEGRERRLVDVSVSMLVPFLAVYVSYGLLDEDRQRFINEAVFREHNQFNLARPPEYDFAGRVGIYSVQVVLAIVAISWVVRWSLGRIEGATQFLALAFVGALVEVYWTTQVARRLTGLETSTTDWVQQRRAVSGVKGWYDDSVTRFGWLAHPVDSVTTWVFGLVGSLDAVVVVPIAWLTVGAVVLGHKLSPPTPPDPHQRWQRIPHVVRRTGSSLTADLRERWSAFWGGLRLLGAAGLMPMLVFSLAFLIAIRVPWLVSHLLRLLEGPVDTDTWLAFAPIERGLGLAVSMAITAPLLAAAVEWLVTPQVEEELSGADSRTINGTVNGTGEAARSPAP